MCWLSHLWIFQIMNSLTSQFMDCLSDFQNTTGFHEFPTNIFPDIQQTWFSDFLKVNTDVWGAGGGRTDGPWICTFCWSVEQILKVYPNKAGRSFVLPIKALPTFWAHGLWFWILCFTRSLWLSSPCILGVTWTTQLSTGHLLGTMQGTLMGNCHL